jgi:hypothetical protein
VEIEIAKHTDRTYSILMPVGHERIGCQVTVALGVSPYRPGVEHLRAEAAVSRAKKLAHELLAAIEAWEKGRSPNDHKPPRDLK